MPKGKMDAVGSLAGPIEQIFMICIAYWLFINIKAIRHLNSTKSFCGGVTVYPKDPKSPKTLINKKRAKISL